MATVIKTDGTKTNVRPENGKTFGLEEMQDIVGGYIEIVSMGDGNVMVMNEEGKYLCEPNPAASEKMLALGAIFPFDEIYGDVLVCRSEEVD